MTITLRSDPAVLQKAYDLYTNSLTGLHNIQGIIWALAFQPLPRSVTTNRNVKDRNVLGLRRSPPLVIVVLSATWDNDRDTSHIVETARALLLQIEEAAKRAGKYNGYKDMSYADQDQDPVSGYGMKNKKYLESVSKTYDRDRVFQKACSGGFKLFS